MRNKENILFLCIFKDDIFEKIFGIIDIKIKIFDISLFAFIQHPAACPLPSVVKRKNSEAEFIHTLEKRAVLQKILSPAGEKKNNGLFALRFKAGICDSDVSVSALKMLKRKIRLIFHQ